MFKSLLFSIGLGLCATAINADDNVPQDTPEVSNRPRYHVDILRLDPETETLTHVCDGAILDTHFLITAAHCVYEEKTENLRIRSGSDVAPPVEMPHKEKRHYHNVKKIMYPKDYVYTPCRHHEHDIAILKVNSAFDLAYDVLYKNVDLPEADNDYESYIASLSGYNDGKLNSLEVKVISNEECIRQSSSILTGGNVCGIFSEEAAQLLSQAISGGPLVYENTLVGIMNAGAKCEDNENLKIKCVEQSPNLKLYTRVSVYREFIENVLNRQPSADIVYKS